MNFRALFLLLILAFTCLDCQSQDQIRLIVRGDDIGSTHAANLGCIKSYQEGIMRSVEIMVPCAWFPEAVSILNENPGLDVGIHLTFTSEWENIKWRPLTNAPSITDEDGYLFPMIWPNDNFPENRTLRGSDWKLEPGKTYLFVEHPALADSEMEAIGHEGYYGVNDDRQMVTEMFTSEEVMRVIKEREIKLISYADLVE